MPFSSLALSSSSSPRQRPLLAYRATARLAHKNKVQDRRRRQDAPHASGQSQQGDLTALAPKRFVSSRHLPILLSNTSVPSPSYCRPLRRRACRDSAAYRISSDVRASKQRTERHWTKKARCSSTMLPTPFPYESHQQVGRNSNPFHPQTAAFELPGQTDYQPDDRTGEWSGSATRRSSTGDGEDGAGEGADSRNAVPVKKLSTVNRSAMACMLCRKQKVSFGLSPGWSLRAFQSLPLTFSAFNLSRR